MSVHEISHRKAGRTGGACHGAPAFTLVELIVSVGIISLLATAALPNLRRFQVQAKVSACRNNQRVLTDAMEFYHVDHGRYPQPLASSQDSLGVVARAALRGLTTPVAYANPDAFEDPFGEFKLQLPVASRPSSLSDDPFRPPRPGFNEGESLLYFYYPRMAALMGLPAMWVKAYSIVSAGPDLKDSFALYYPFPENLPARAALFGVDTIQDAVYDPTNGTISGGDLAAFGGDLPVPRFVGGGQ